MVHLVCGGRQFQLLVHVPVRQAHGAVQVEEPGFGSELQGHGGTWSLREALQLHGLITVNQSCRARPVLSGALSQSEVSAFRPTTTLWGLILAGSQEAASLLKQDTETTITCMHVSLL